LKGPNRNREIAKEESTPLGVSLVVEGNMTMPDGAVAAVRAL